MAVLKDLIVHGRSRFVNGAQFNTINAESIGANEGIFNKLIATTLDAKEATIEDLRATNATIVGLLDVQGQMQTNSWTNANIATIDGSFYICPTISSEATVTTSGTTQTSNNKFVYNSSGGTIILTGTWATTGSLYLNDTAANWNLYSKIMITGEVLIGNEWTPIGTIRGVLQGINTSNGTITIGSLSSNITVGADGTINSLPAILSLVTSGTTYNARKLKVSLYEYNSNGTSSGATNLIGIMMTTAGTHNFTYLDIYNGLNSKTSYTSTVDNTTKATEPMVRIGNLNGLPNIVSGSNDMATKPTGWGIYTTNGFFKGKIVSNAGVIGGWTISDLKLYTGSHDTYDSNDNGIYLGQGSVSNDYFISGGPEAQWYLKSDGTGRIGDLILTKETVGSEEIFTATLPAANITGLLKANQIDTEFITVGLDEVVSGTITYIYEPSAGDLKTVFKDNINNTYYYVEEQDSYVLTEDTTVVEGKTYYSKNGSTYTPITNPTGNPHNNNYYEVVIIEQRIPVDESQLKEENGTLVTNRADDGLGTRIQSITNITEPLQDKVNRHLVEEGSGENESLSVQVGSEVDTYLKLDGSGIKLYAKSGDNLETIAQYGTDIILGKEDGAHIQLSNDIGLQFYNSNSDSSTAVAFVNSEVLSINQAQILNTLQIGDFTWNKSVKTISNTQYERVSLVYS